MSIDNSRAFIGYDAYLESGNPFAADDLPEECPQCGKPNGTAEGEWLAPEAQPFCSKLCSDAYNEASYQQMLAMDDIPF